MPEEAEDLIGGRYLLAEPASQGVLGRIWRGRDQLLDREVAVMEISLRPRPGDRADLVEDILREVRAAARRRGPGEIAVLDVAEQADALWVVTQPGDGEPLDAELTRTAAPSGDAAPSRDAAPVPSARAPRTAPPAPGPADRRAGSLVTALRANTALTVGVVTGIVMVLALLLVVALFPSHPKPASPPGRPMITPTAPSGRELP
jgi:hypothetical protein